MNDYNVLLEKYNKLLGKYNEEHSNSLNYQRMLKEREKNFLITNKEKDKKIKELEDKIYSLEHKQIDMFVSKKMDIRELKQNVEEVVRYMTACLNDARKYATKNEYEILKACYEYPLKILKKE